MNEGYFVRLFRQTHLVSVSVMEVFLFLVWKIYSTRWMHLCPQALMGPHLPSEEREVSLLPVLMSSPGVVGTGGQALWVSQFLGQSALLCSSAMQGSDG